MFLIPGARATSLSVSSRRNNMFAREGNVPPTTPSPARTIAAHCPCPAEHGDEQRFRHSYLCTSRSPLDSRIPGFTGFGPRTHAKPPLPRTARAHGSLRRFIGNCRCGTSPEFRCSLAARLRCRSKRARIRGCQVLRLKSPHHRSLPKTWLGRFSYHVARRSA